MDSGENATGEATLSGAGPDVIHADPSEAQALQHDPVSPEPGEGLRWEITYDNPENPFTANLVFTEDNEPVLWWNLDPVTLKNLSAALALVQDAQVEALTGKKPERASTTKPISTKRAQVDKADRSWWARHKITTGFLIVIGLMMLVSFFIGGSRV